MDHPSEETLQRFSAGKASREESRAVVVHLLKGCCRCAEALRGAMTPEPVFRGAYDPALDRFDEGLIESLEGSLDPLRLLRSLLRGAPPGPAEKEPRKKR